MEIKANVPVIISLVVATKVKEEPMPGGEKGETIRRLITTVKFEYEGTGAAFDGVLHAVAEEIAVGVEFNSKQLAFERV